MRLRVTAFPTLRDIEKATCGLDDSCCSSAKGKKRIRMSPVRTWSPRTRISENVCRSEIPDIKLSACADPCDDGCLRFHVQRVWTSVSGTHASWPACGRLVDMCASFIFSESCEQRSMHARRICRVGCRRRTHSPSRERTHQDYDREQSRNNLSRPRLHQFWVSTEIRTFSSRDSTIAPIARECRAVN